MIAFGAACAVRSMRPTRSGHRSRLLRLGLRLDLHRLLLLLQSGKRLLHVLRRHYHLR